MGFTYPDASDSDPNEQRAEHESRRRHILRDAGESAGIVPGATKLKRPLKSVGESPSKLARIWRGSGALRLEPASLEKPRRVDSNMGNPDDLELLTTATPLKTIMPSLVAAKIALPNLLSPATHAALSGRFSKA